MEQEVNWIGKRIRLELLKDGEKLFYTATIIKLDDSEITFKDRDGLLFSFKKEFVVQMREINGSDTK